MKTIFIIAVVTILAACTPDITMQMGTAPNVDGMTHNVTERISVTRVGVFRDDTAYKGRRSVYVIVDRKTGKEYIGVSGVGISETESHNNR